MGLGGGAQTSGGLLQRVSQTRGIGRFRLAHNVTDGAFDCKGGQSRCNKTRGKQAIRLRKV